ncbi:hypothetical protein NG799_06635 [Laspinema sp. D1]|uniref:Uncharacterized protein n=1 Tax=Laspinema palackyanum D2a TaxID=2953684 RepID=A0ABT2MMQ7_9CYAN|nr:hypothetical protein [Laspinema sp. D2a]
MGSSWSGDSLRESFRLPPLHAIKGGELACMEPGANLFLVTKAIATRRTLHPPFPRDAR